MVTDDGPALERLVARIDDEALRSRITREIDLLRDSRRFGLVFDRHLPETVRLPDHPVRPGVSVSLRDESSAEVWAVASVADRSGEVVRLSDGSERPVSELVVVREFSEPILPGLRSLERIGRGAEDDPWHVVIEGENAHALQLLRSTHRGLVDLIYIDPPYNTGNDGWIYNDRYVDVNDRARSSKWLSFMERRLTIARDLLAPTGVVIVAIGDDEHHRLRMLMDQVFGASNFISDVVWQGGRKNDSRYVSNGADYMLVYARDESTMAEQGIRWREEKPGLRDALEKAKALWDQLSGDPAQAAQRWKAWLKRAKAEGRITDSVARYDSLHPDTGRAMNTYGNITWPGGGGGSYDIIHPTTGRPVKAPARGWIWRDPDRMSREIAAGRIWFGVDEGTIPRGIGFLDQMDSQVALSVFAQDRKAASTRMRGIFGETRFPNPKDHEVLMRWIGLAAPRDALILDFFGGSGTTTEAVMRLNAADGGTRRSILVTNNEVGSRAAKALRKEGHHPGDPAWEAQGVFEHVTRPRIRIVATGERPDGSTYSDAVAANVEFFALTHLDSGRVRRGRELAAVAPVLWLENGGTGDCIDEEPDAGWALANRYGVLFDVDTTPAFVIAAQQHEHLDRVYVVSDSPAEVRSVADRLPSSIDVIGLFDDYLRRFEGTHG